MADDNWHKEYKARQDKLLSVAKNPTPGTSIYRGSAGEGKGSVGLHWSVNRDAVINHVGYDIHHAIIDDPKGQVIPYGATATSYTHDVTNQTLKLRRQSVPQGLPSESEVRLRPGATIRMASGETQTVTAGGIAAGPEYNDHTRDYSNRSGYLNLHQWAVKGTDEHRRLENINYGLPHTQPALFDEMVDHKLEKPVGYTPSWEASDDGSDGAFDKYLKTSGKFNDDYEAKHGRWAMGTNMAKPLKDLNTKPHMASPQFESHREIPGQLEMF